MKKSLIVLMLVLSFVIVGCSNSKSDSKKEESKEETFKILFEGVDITPGMEFSEEKIKKSAKKSEIPSCAFEGKDTVYTYDDLEITVATKDDKKIIYSVYFLTPNIKTSEGISIDSSKDDLVKTYGNINNEDDVLYTKGSVELHFILSDNSVSNIEYILKTDKK